MVEARLSNDSHTITSMSTVASTARPICLSTSDLAGICWTDCFHHHQPGSTTPRMKTGSIDHDKRSRTSRTSVCTALASMLGSMTTP